MNRILRLTTVLALVSSVSSAQTPLMFSKAIQPASALDPRLRAAVKKQAGPYALDGFAFFGTDSLILIFADSALTRVAHESGKWMFGPPATAAEMDGCPAEKVLARKIARALFRALGRPTKLQQVDIAVRGTVGIDRWTGIDMYFYPEHLSGKWAGDPIP